MSYIINSAYKETFFSKLRDSVEEQILAIQMGNKNLEDLAPCIKDIVASLYNEYKTEIEISNDDKKYWQMPSNPKILIIGEEQHLKKNDILGIAKSFNISKDQIDFLLDYNRIGNYNFGVLEYSGVYSDVIFGANPHSTIDKACFSSITEKIKQNQTKYPKLHLLRVNSSAGELKLTKTGLKQALQDTRLYKYTTKN